MLMFHLAFLRPVLEDTWLIVSRFVTCSVVTLISVGNFKSFPKQFGDAKASQIQRDFGQLRYLIMNISGFQQEISRGKQGCNLGLL